jgi:hypothetical protein
MKDTGMTRNPERHVNSSYQVSSIQPWWTDCLAYSLLSFPIPFLLWHFRVKKHFIMFWAYAKKKISFKCGLRVQVISLVQMTPPWLLETVRVTELLISINLLSWNIRQTCMTMMLVPCLDRKGLYSCSVCVLILG